ncbi:type VII secretion protein EssA [Listeria fleischmannii]|uniref:Uncharacterized protein n=1 Tax=Listeria fleischmannii FSL S10-1203 TaxID=1265822 RepID=W7DKY1_9LIST|nr:type VII secretion protein EssA [Listeria fleischmannii]EUJ52904.1 hypothetical protein MCOL2_11532 [Listeria fleischmannii FSL S10-1203]
MKIFKIGIFFLLCFSFFALNGTASLAAEDGYLENDGKMEMKADRLQKSDEEKTQEANPQETMLDELKLPLFTEQLDKKIEAQKKAEAEKYQKLQDQLFTGKDVSDQTVKETKDKLFEGKYASKTNQEVVEVEGEKTNSKMVIAIVFGIVLALAGGIYFASRNVME